MEEEDVNRDVFKEGRFEGESCMKRLILISLTVVSNVIESPNFEPLACEVRILRKRVIVAKSVTLVTVSKLEVVSNEYSRTPTIN